MQLRDKSYIRLNNGMLFNVTGYEHPPGGVYASLKYIAGKKWTDGYDAARDYLLNKMPGLVDENRYIFVPFEYVSSVYDPFERWAELKRGVGGTALHREAFELADVWSQLLDGCEFGITDSLLWGNGTRHSDIDLVVQGRDAARRILAAGEFVFSHEGMERPTAVRMTAPYGLSVTDWPRLLSRKVHMGCYRGRLFSLRVVLSDEEIGLPVGWEEVAERVTIDFEICDTTDGLSFPAIFRNQKGDQLVDYSVLYEGVFRSGDRVRCECQHLQMAEDQPMRIARYVIKRVTDF